MRDDHGIRLVEVFSVGGFPVGHHGSAESVRRISLYVGSGGILVSPAALLAVSCSTAAKVK